MSGTIATPSSGTNTATINTQTGRLFTVNQTVDGTFAGNIAGAGSFALGSLSTSSLTLTGNNTISGGVTVSAGRLIVDGSFSNAANGISVANGAALGGDGSIAGEISFASGANFIFNTAATLDVTGSVTFGGFSVANLLGLDASTVAGTYVLLNGTGSNISSLNVLTGQANKIDLSPEKFAYLNFTNGDLAVVVSAIPEPGSFAALAGLASFGLVGLRRRRSAR